jgi:hypothetical protein
MEGNYQIYYTTAPESYDGFGTETIEMMGLYDTRGKELRKVKIFDKNYNWQSSRYNSGIHGVFGQKEFDELMSMSYPTFTRKEEPKKENNTTKMEEKKEIQNASSENLKYIPQSEACVSVDTITPSDMRYEMLKAIETIDRRVNGVDEYVAEKLGYIVGNASPEERVKGIKYLCDAFSSEQVDAIAVAIYNIENKGQGCIIGDQTGIGKGRIAGGVIRYAMKQGLKPIFITEKTNLFSDIFRDLISIGSDSDIPLKILVGTEFVERKSVKKEKLTKEEKEELEAERKMDEANGVVNDEEEEEAEGELVEKPIYKKNKDYPNKFVYEVTDENGVIKKVTRERRFIAKPFILNSKDSKTQTRIEIKDEDGHILYYSDDKLIQQAVGKREATSEVIGTTPKGKPKYKQIFIQGSMAVPSDCDFVLATYSQFMRGVNSPKNNYLRNIAKNNIIIMDESHNASGNSNVGKFLRDVLATTLGVTFLSATFAKRPDNMPIYASKTCIGDANLDSEDLITAIISGGVALQQVVSSQLVLEGQMIRRERSYDGIEVNYKFLDHSQTLIGKPDLNMEVLNTAIMDNATDIIRAIIEFQKKHVDPLIAKLNKLLAEGQGGASSIKGTEEAGIKNTPAFSGVFNVINQLLFSIKAEAVGKVAVERLREGKKPVISFASTMESFLNDLKNENGENVKVGDIINSDFSKVFERRLRNTLKYKKTNAEGEDEILFIDPEEQSDEFRNAYRFILSKIRSSAIGISSSPIDVVIDVIKKAGYSVSEVTGRTRQLKLLGDDLAEIQSKVKEAPNDAFRKFNNNEVDVLLINQSGSTGASAHAVPTKKVPKEQVKQRVMIFLQSELNVNTEVQKRGRINRTGQILSPIYDYVISSVPAEKRLSMMLQKKLKSLSANTTSSQADAMSGAKEKLVLDPDNIDFLDKYGDKIIFEWLLEHPEVNLKIDDPLGITKSDKPEDIGYENASSKISGRIAILPIKIQEQFYTEVSEKYYADVTLLIDTDEYDLEVKSLNLQAETLEKSIRIVGKGGKSVFSKNTILEKCLVNNLRKPFTSQEVRKLVENALGNLTAEQIQYNLVNEFESYMTSKTEQDINSLNNFYKESIENIPKEKAILKLKEEEDKAKIIESKREEYQNDWDEAVENIKNINESKTRNLKNIFNYFYIGKTIAYPILQGKDYVYSIFLGFDFTKKDNNNYAPSSIRLKFALAGSLKYISLPASKNDIIAQIRVLVQDNFVRTPSLEDTLSNWDGIIRSKLSDRIERFIVTGNILQAFGERELRGNLISYTTIDGKLKKGILLPETFFQGKYGGDSNGIKVPILKALKVIKAMGYRRLQTSGDATLIADEEYNTYYNKRMPFLNLEVPKSAKIGAIYYQDSTLIELSQTGTFNSVGNTMVARYDVEKIDQLIEYLQKEFNLAVTLSKSQYLLIEDDIIIEEEDDDSYNQNETDEFLRKLDEANKQAEENARLEKENQERLLREQQEAESRKINQKRLEVISKLQTLILKLDNQMMAKGGKVKKVMNEFKQGNMLEKGGELTHKHSHTWGETITIRLIEPTAKGWKVEQRIVKGKSAPKTKIAYFTKADIEELFH